MGAGAERPPLVRLSTCSFTEINVFSDFVIDKDDNLISPTCRSRAFGGEGALRRGGKLDLPGVSGPLASGPAQVDLPEEPAPGAQQGAGEQLEKTKCPLFLPK